MSTIKHQCPSCGGGLIVDNDKQLYRCSSCGSTYDFDYFREEKLHDMGETHLSRKEYAAAVDAYNLILENDPHDFYALRGLMLASAYLNDMDGLIRVGEAKYFRYDPKIVSRVIASASEEDKESRKDSYLGDNSGPKVSIIIISIICGIWFFVALFFVLGLIGAITSNASGAAFDVFLVLTVIHVSIFLGLLTYTLVALVPKAVKLKRLDKSNTPLYVEAGKVDEKINALDSEIQKLSAQSRRTIHNFVKKDRAIMNELTGQM